MLEGDPPRLFGRRHMTRRRTPRAGGRETRDGAAYEALAIGSRPFAGHRLRRL